MKIDSGIERELRWEEIERGREKGREIGRGGRENMGKRET